VEKMKKIAIIMQRMHKPQISQTKRQEVANEIERLKSKSFGHKLPKSAAYSPRIDESLKVGNALLRYPWRGNMSKNPKMKNAIVLPQIMPKYQDYLVALRSKRKPKHADERAMHSIMDMDMTNPDKFERVKYQVKQIEEMAKRKEMLSKLKKDTSHATYEEASDLYIGAIKAKLTLLNKLDSSVH
jgi:hypothetical protein